MSTQPKTTLEAKDLCDTKLLRAAALLNAVALRIEQLDIQDNTLDELVDMAAELVSESMNATDRLYQQSRAGHLKVIKTGS